MSRRQWRGFDTPYEYFISQHFKRYMDRLAREHNEGDWQVNYRRAHTPDALDKRGLRLRG